VHSPDVVAVSQIPELMQGHMARRALICPRDLCIESAERPPRGGRDFADRRGGAFESRKRSGTLSGRLVLAGAESSLPALASANVLPAQSPYTSPGNRSA
jgi:hypothetical protein